MSELAARSPAYARRLYLMRHGDVSYFDEQGRPYPPNDVTMTARGQQQAQAAARVLAGTDFQRVISSDLPRTIATADAVSSDRKIVPERARSARSKPGRLGDST